MKRIRTAHHFKTLGSPSLHHQQQVKHTVVHGIVLSEIGRRTMDISTEFGRKEQVRLHSVVGILHHVSLSITDAYAQRGTYGLALLIDQGHTHRGWLESSIGRTVGTDGEMKIALT